MLSRVQPAERPRPDELGSFMNTRKCLSIYVTLMCLTGCVALPDEQLIGAAAPLSEYCKKMFLATGIDCPSDRSLCASNGFQNVISYQESAQGAENAVFAVVEDSSGKVASCNWSTAGFMRGMEYLENRALATCERTRMTLISKTGNEYRACRIFARNNDVL